LIILRAHHLLCLLGFRGFGYSIKFIENLEEIYKKVRQVSPLIKIIAGEDDVCKACPLIKENCRSRRNPIKLDTAVLLKLKIKAPLVIKSRVVYKKIAQNFKGKDLDIICKGCRWLERGWCKEGLEELKSEVAV